MMDRQEWEAAREEAVSVSNTADRLADRQFGDFPRPSIEASTLATIMQAKALALIALFVADLVEPLAKLSDPTKQVYDSLPASIKKGDDRGPGYSVD